jgi:hypothetical protein
VHLRDLRGERATRKGIDRERCLLTHLDGADVRLVDGDVQLHLLEVLGERKQHGRLQRRRHGLARFDGAHEHDAVDRRADLGLAEIRAHRRQARARLRDGSCGGGTLAIGLRDRGLGDVEILLRRELVVAELADLEQALVIRTCFLRGGGGLRDVRLRRRERAFGLQHLGLQTLRVERGEHLTLADLVVDVDVDQTHGARELAADVDLVARLEIAGRRDRDRQRAARHRFGRVFDLRGAFAAREKIKAQQQRERHGNPLAPAQPGLRRCRAEIAQGALDVGVRRGRLRIHVQLTGSSRLAVG